MRSRLVALAFALALGLTACSSSGETSGDEVNGPADPTGQPASQYAPARVPAGMAVELTNDVDSKGVVLLESPQVIDPPEFWGDEKITIAKVTITATQGRLEFAETAFTLVTADGTRQQASTVASSNGLPGAALGTGGVSAPDKVAGLITIGYPGPITGSRIGLVSDAIWTLS